MAKLVKLLWLFTAVLVNDPPSQLIIYLSQDFTHSIQQDIHLVNPGPIKAGQGYFVIDR